MSNKFEFHGFTCSDPFGSDLKAYILKLLGLGLSNMSFLIEDLIQFVPGTMTPFLQGNGTKIRSNQFSEFGSQT